MEIEQALQRLPKHQRAILRILSDGGKYSAADLTVRTHYCDPRGHIKELRDKGIDILDEWRQTDDGIRYKVYYLNRRTKMEQANKPTFKEIEDRYVKAVTSGQRQTQITLVMAAIRWVQSRGKDEMPMSRRIKAKFDSEVRPYCVALCRQSLEKQRDELMKKEAQNG